MQLSTDNKITLQLVLKEPYRLFFPLGWLSLVVGVGYWILFTLHITDSYLPRLHGLIQIELFCSAFIYGFLLTAIPKFLRTDHINATEFLLILLTYLILSVQLLTNSIFSSQITFCLLNVIFAYFIWSRWHTRKAEPPLQFQLLHFAALCAIIGPLLTLISDTYLNTLGLALIEKAWLLLLVLSIGTFLGPRLMGIVDTTSSFVSLAKRTHTSSDPEKVREFKIIFIGFLIILSFILDGMVKYNATHILRAGACLYCLYHFGIFTRPRSRSLVAWLVAISLWSISLGLLISPFSADAIGTFHIAYISGIGMLILAISAQISSSHAGFPEFWGLNRKAFQVVGAMVLLSALARVVAFYFSGYYLSLIATSSALFLAASTIWILKVKGLFIRSP